MCAGVHSRQHSQTVGQGVWRNAEPVSEKTIIAVNSLGSKPVRPPLYSGHCLL